MIIDAHQHFWNIEEPWSKAPEDYKILAMPEGVTGTILRLEETQLALDIAAKDPFVVAVSGKIEPGPEFEHELEKYSADPLFRGVSYIGRYFENVEKSGFLTCMEKVATKGMTLDLLRVVPGFWGGPKAMQKAYPGTQESLNGMLKIAECLPNLSIVLQHFGGMPIDGKPITPEWEEVFQKLAKHPHITVKVSGMMGRDTSRAKNERATESLAFYRPMLDALWRIFGEDRLMYASNWPVCEHEGDFIANGIRIVRRYFSEKGFVACEKFFWKNSLHAYKWSPRTTAQTF